MKRLFSLGLCTLVCLGLLPTNASGYRLSDIRGQAQEHSARLGIPIILPQSERAPVLRLKESPILPELPQTDGVTYAQAVPGAYGMACNDPVWQNYGHPDMRYNLPKGQEFAWQRISPPWDFAHAYPENNPLSLGEALAFVQEHGVKATGGSARMDLFAFSTINSGQRGSATIRGYDILPPYGPGAYDLALRQVIEGWMVMDSITNHLDDNGFRGRHPATIFRESQARIMGPEAFFIGISFLEVDEVLADDMPLCPPDKVTAAYERLIQQGQVGRMSELRLGYVLFPDPSQPGKAIAFPCWLMKAEYLGKSCNPAAALSVEDSPHYAQLLVNARTGELIGPRITREQDALAPEWAK